MNTTVPTIQERKDVDILASLGEIETLTKVLMKTKHYEKIGPDGIFAMCMVADGIGMPRIDALNGELYYTQGRVGMGYEAMNKYIRSRGHSVQVKVLDDKCCTLVGKRKDNGDTAELTYTMEDARRAGKSYDKYPKSMLFARCLSMLKRFLFPDVCTKVYVKEELEDFKDDEAIEARVTPSDIKRIADETQEPTITADQREKLCQLLEKCDAGFKERVHKYLNKQGFEELRLSVELYNRAYESALENAAEHMKEVVDAV